MGVQGHKRVAAAGADVMATVDPVAEDVDFKSIKEVPLDAYDAVLACVPDQAKMIMLGYLLEHGKHVLVEKPILAEDETNIRHLRELAAANGAVCYTAYNHRFEPHFVRMKELITSGVLGRIYTLRMFYGNGTARLVRDSAWRDEGAGVLPDLGSQPEKLLEIIGDYDALIAGRPQAFVNNPDGAYQLFRIGDAVANRDIHAAIYDALRLMKDV